MIKVIAIMITLALSTSANAALVLRLDGRVVYDTVQDISWLADTRILSSNTFGLETGVNLGLHSSDLHGVEGQVRSNGTMNEPGAFFLLDAMNEANYLGFDDWRLPTTLVPDTSCDNVNSTGFYCTGSEMGNLYYNEFGGQKNIPSLDHDLRAMFSGIRTDFGAYLSGTENEVNPYFVRTFGFFSGVQGASLHPGNINYAMIVRTGDVSPVPIPAAAWLFGSALLGLAGIKRSKAARRKGSVLICTKC